MNLRICFYFFRLEASFGGAERMLLRLAQEFFLRGYEVHIVSWDVPGAKAAYPIVSGIFWHQLGFKTGFLDKFRRSFVLMSCLKKIHCDVFIGFVMGADKTVYLANLLAGVPIIAAERNSPEMYRLKLGYFSRKFYEALFFLVRRVVVQISAYQQGYPKALRKRIVTIANPVDPINQAACPAKKYKNYWTLLSVARLEDQKNLEALILAFAELMPNFPEWRLRIVGEGQKRTQLEALITEKKLESYVSLLGVTNQLQEEYQNAHLFCLPSRWEGFPNALAEAMAHGLPVLGFKSCPGVNSLIRDGINGFLANDQADLVLQLKKLMSNPELRVQIGAQALSISEEFSLEQIMQQWEQTVVASCKRRS